MNWEPGVADWIALIAVLVALPTLLVAWLTYRKAHPRRVLYYSLEATPVLALESPDIKVLVGDRQVVKPYVATLAFELIGPGEVLYESFSGNRPLVLRIGSEILNRPQLEGEKLNEMLVQVESSGEIKIGPGVMKPGFYGQIRLITDGEPIVEIKEDSLRAVALTDAIGEKFSVEARYDRHEIAIMATAVVGVTVLLCASTVLGLSYLDPEARPYWYQGRPMFVPNYDEMPTWLGWLTISPILLMVLVVIVSILSMIAYTKNMRSAKGHLSRKASFNRRMPKD